MSEGHKPAFPCLEYNESGIGDCITLNIGGEKQYIPFNKGVSKRFYAACAAMQGLLSKFRQSLPRQIRQRAGANRDAGL